MLVRKAHGSVLQRNQSQHERLTSVHTLCPKESSDTFDALLVLREAVGQERKTPPKEMRAKFRPSPHLNHQDP